MLYQFLKLDLSRLANGTEENELVCIILLCMFLSCAFPEMKWKQKQTEQYRGQGSPGASRGGAIATLTISIIFFREEFSSLISSNTL